MAHREIISLNRSSSPLRRVGGTVRALLEAYPLEVAIAIYLSPRFGWLLDIVSARRDADAVRQFFHRALSTLKVTPLEVVTDKAAVYPKVLDELMPAAWHHLERWTNNRIEADHSRLKQRLRPMRGLCTDRTATVIITDVAFMQNLRRGHYELAVDLPAPLRVAAAFTELARAI